MGNESGESLILSLFKRLLVGACVAFVGLIASAIMLVFLSSLREVGLLFLLILLPLAACFTWYATGKYLAGEPHYYRGAVGLGVRYFVMGATIGLLLKFVMGGWISDTALFVSLGSAIGTIAGSFGGAFQGRIHSREIED